MPRTSRLSVVIESQMSTEGPDLFVIPNTPILPTNLNTLVLGSLFLWCLYTQVVRCPSRVTSVKDYGLNGYTTLTPSSFSSSFTGDSLTLDSSMKSSEYHDFPVYNLQFRPGETRMNVIVREEDNVVIGGRLRIIVSNQNI